VGIRTVVTAVVALTPLLVLALVSGAFAPDTAWAGEKANVPNFVLKNLAGKDVSLEDLRAKGPVIIDFWATWCKPCLRELPFVDALREEYGERGLQVAAISIDDTRSLPKVKSYVKTHDYGFEVLLDTNKRTLRRLQGGNVPYLIVVSPTGENLYTHCGYRDGDEKELAEVVAEAMAEFAPAPPDESIEGSPDGGGASESANDEAQAEPIDGEAPSQEEAAEVTPEAGAGG
jgi:thiol-disulfide isomerase/thioredoxin